MKYLLSFILILFVFRSNSQKNTILIDSSIKPTAIKKVFSVDKKKNLSLSEIGLFKTKVKYSRIINDTLNLRTNESEVFSGVYYYKQDTLIVVISSENRYEAIVLVSLNDSIKAFYEQSNHENATLYSLTENGLLTGCLNVPYQKIDVRLSSKINKDTKEVIYGYLDFQTCDYYYDSRMYEFLERKKYKKQVKVKMFFLLEHY